MLRFSIQRVAPNLASQALWNDVCEMVSGHGRNRPSISGFCEPPCADFVAGTACVELEAENWRLCRTTLVRGVSGELEDENW